MVDFTYMGLDLSTQQVRTIFIYTYTKKNNVRVLSTHTHTRFISLFILT